MKIRPEHEFLFAAPGAKKWLTRRRVQRANAILPLTFKADPREMGPSDYLYADDPRALALKERLHEMAEREFPPDVRPTGFCGPTGVPGGFSVLRNVSGIGMDPLPLPLVSNDSFVASRGLVNAIRPADRPWLAELVRLFFGAARPTNLHIRSAASTGFPYFTTDVEYKKLAALKTLREPDRFLSLMTGESAGLKEAADVYHAVAVAAIHERQQPNAIIDGKSKPRTAPTEQEARTGQYAGKTFADMTARRQDGSVIDGHFAMRRRDVFGMNGPINYFLTAIIGCFRSVYLDRFAFTYKTRGSEDKAERVRKYTYVVGSDVKTMDKLIPRWFLKEVLDLLPNYLDERVVELMRRAYQAPFVCPPPWAKTSESYDPVFGGSPMDPKSFVNHPGLPSGVAFNPDWGKLWMTFVYAVLYKDIGALLRPEQLEGFLQGRHPDHALLDTADDAAFLTNSARVAEALKTPKSPYAELEVEVPVIYLGDVFSETSSGKDAFPNPITYLANLLCREDSIDRKGPVLFAQGYLARDLVYSRSPVFRDLSLLLQSEVRSATGVNPLVLCRSLATVEGMTEVDAMVIANPASIHYKVDPSTVSKEVLDSVVSTIPAGDFFPYIKHLFKVPTS